MMPSSWFLDDPVSCETLDTVYYLSTEAGELAEAQSKEFGVQPEDALFEKESAFVWEEANSRRFLEGLTT